MMPYVSMGAKITTTTTAASMITTTTAATPTTTTTALETSVQVLVQAELFSFSYANKQTDGYIKKFNF